MAFSNTVCFIIGFSLVLLAAPTNGLEDNEAWRRAVGDPQNLCRTKCLQDVLDEHCDGMACSDEHDAAMLRQLCTVPCVCGIAGEKMRRCLFRSFPNGEDLEGFQNLLIQDAQNHCNDQFRLDASEEAEASMPAVSYDEIEMCPDTGL